MIKIYKFIVLVSYLIYSVFFFLPYLDMYLYNQETLDALSWAGYGAVLEPYEPLGYILFTVYSITLFGLLTFKPWARTTFVILTLATVLLTGLQGIEVLMPADGVLSYLTNLADGATIIIIYFTSISNRFNEST